MRTGVIKSASAAALVLSSVSAIPAPMIAVRTGASGRARSSKQGGHSNGWSLSTKLFGSDVLLVFVEMAHRFR
jgi:hypothetical protein